MEADTLECGNCGARLDDEALVAGRCSYCAAAVVLPRKPGTKRSHVISKPGEELVVRISDDQGERVEKLEGIVFGAPSDASEPQAPVPAPADSSAPAAMLTIVACLGLVIALLVYLFVF